MKLKIFVLTIFFIANFYDVDAKKLPPYNFDSDTTEVKRLNEQAYQNRLTDPAQSITSAKKALDLSQKINFIDGEAESHRVIGIGYYYLNQRDSSLNNYLKALSLFSNSGNLLGEAKVSNNIGNLWLEIDYDKSLFFFKKTLEQMFITFEESTTELVVSP